MWVVHDPTIMTFRFKNDEAAIRGKWLRGELNADKMSTENQ